MKPIAFCFIALFIASCAKNDVKLEASTINTPTMICGTCAETIEKAVYRVEGVKEVNVDLEKKLVEVKYVGLQTNLEYLESAITAVGYDANDKKRDPDAYEKLDACCKTDMN
jgi:copper chaperone CopZ